MSEAAATSGEARIPGAAVAVVSEDSTDESSRLLARRLSLPLHDRRSAASFPLWLVNEPSGLALASHSPGGPGPVRVDFVHGATRHRIATSFANQPLIQASGWKKGCVTLIDATAGLGADAYQLAAIGHQVTACERNGVLSVLLEDGLLRARRCGLREISDAAGRIALHTGDARKFLRSLRDEDRPDTIYLDPMFIARDRRAVNKEMAVCRHLVGDDDDAGELASVAMATTRRRVVIKRHRRAEPLCGEPDFHVSGKLTRYDVYTP